MQNVVTDSRASIPRETDLAKVPFGDAAGLLEHPVRTNRWTRLAHLAAEPSFLLTTGHVGWKIDQIGIPRSPPWLNVPVPNQSYKSHYRLYLCRQRPRLRALTKGILKPTVGFVKAVP